MKIRPGWLRHYVLFLAVLCWAAMICQFGLSVMASVSKGRGVWNGILAYFSYFTILTNLLCGVTLACWVLAEKRGGGKSRAVSFFTSPLVITTLTTSIAIVGIVYSVALRHTWHPRGLERIVDHVHHDAMPPLFVIFWWASLSGEKLRWSAVPLGAVYLVGYMVYAVTLGRFRRQYPYPFMDLNVIGWWQMIGSGAVILAVFLTVQAVLVAWARALAKSRAA